MVYVPSQIFVIGNAARTSNNIINKEFLFRTGILCNLIWETVFIFLVLTLYQLLKKVNERLAKIMVALVIVSVPIGFLVVFNQLFAFITFKEGVMNVFEQTQREALTMAFLKMYEGSTIVMCIF